jgi:hypothetical protein
MRYLLVVLLFVAFAVHSVTLKPTGEQYARCSGHYFTAGIMMAIEDDTENKIYYTLLSMISSDRSYQTMSFEKSQQITRTIINEYGDMITKNQDYLNVLAKNIIRCDRL